MDVSGLSRHLPTQATARGRELAAKMLRGDTIESQGMREAALEQLSTIPEPWLEKLADENLAYVALTGSETLADTNILWSYSPEELKAKAQEAKPLIEEASAELDAETAKLSPDEAAFAQIGRASELSDRLAAKFDANGIGFYPRVQRGETPLEYLHNEFNIADDPYHEFVSPDTPKESEIFNSLLTAVNGEGVIKDGVVDPENDVLIVPYKMRKDRRVSPVTEQSLSTITGLQLDNNLGLNAWPSRLIVVDDQVVQLPSQKTGFHSVLLHESGHAIDYAAEGIKEFDHRATVDRMYAEDMKKFQSGDNLFLTSRAMDNEREYFAEAVEAYLTKPSETPGNFYKQENNHDELKAKNPELFAYVDRVMRWEGEPAA